MATKTLVILDDITPSRATVVRVLADAREDVQDAVERSTPGGQRIAELAEGVALPAVGERVYHRGANFRGVVLPVVTGNQPGR